MKKRTPTARKKASKPKRKPIMRHSREGVRSKARRGTKAKSKPVRKGKPAKAAKSTKAAPKRKAKAKSAARSVTRSAAPKNATPKNAAPKRTVPSRIGSGRRTVDTGSTRGIGAGSAGQSGDTEGLSRLAEADSESVEELLEEGQTFEAGIVSGVEEGRRGGTRGVRTRQVPEDDVPQEYLDEK
ncbi:MAG: hypothetical protein M3167_03515 [Acidobacteriota bacterium]|nr:hypothetical protein [Acidobacteriota bacterium]